MDYNEFIRVFQKYGGKVEKERITSSYYGSRTQETFILPKTDDSSIITHMRIIGGPKPRHGAIGRFVGFIYQGYSSYAPCIEIEWDGRDKNFIGHYFDFDVLDENYSDGTKWIWKTSPHSKDEIPVPVNKYGQELEVGSLVVGIQKKWKSLMFGHVTRYTKSNIWLKPIHFPCDGKKAVDEIQLDNIQQVCLFQEDFLEHLLVIKLMADY